MTSTTDWLARAQHENAQLPDDLLAGDRRGSLRRRIDARLRRRRALRRAAWGGSVLALGAALLLVNAGRNPASPSGARAPATSAAAATKVTVTATATATTVSPTAERAWQFADGSRATALGAATQLRIERDGAVDTLVRLEAGAARFEIQPRADRPFTVRAGPAEVRVIGTRFDVSHRAEGAVEVAVEHGTVQVVTAAGRVLLQAGERRVFTEAAAPTIGADGTRSLAREHAHAARDEPGELLAAADAARREGRVLDAVAALRRLVGAHAGDPRAPSAAFSLGRVLLETRRNPAEAAAAFATARVLDPSGPLAEDALAREVEARARAGSSEQARALAELYLQRYPGGARRDFVRAHAGLDHR